MAYNIDDWNRVEKEKTMFTNERYLPRLIVDAGIMPSISEVKRNRKRVDNIFQNDELVIAYKTDFVIENNDLDESKEKLRKIVEG